MGKIQRHVASGDKAESSVKKKNIEKEKHTVHSKYFIHLKVIHKKSLIKLKWTISPNFGE